MSYLPACSSRHGDSTRVAKANPRATGEWRTIHAVADRMEPRLRAAFLAAYEQAARAKVGTLKAVEEAIKSGSTNEIVYALNLDGMQLELEHRLRAGEFTDALTTTYTTAGNAVMPSILNTLGRTRSADFVLRFNAQHPRAVEFLRAYDGSLIRELSTEFRKSILSVVQTAFQEGGHPYSQARIIRNLDGFGLTTRQNAAVTNYRRSLEENIKGPKLDRLVDIYRRKLLKFRSENIARTETIRASESGHHEAWKQAADAGLFDPNTARRHWVITPDDRLCDSCSQIPDLNPEGVSLEDVFNTPFGLVPQPPAHPQCRCSQVMRFPEDDVVEKGYDPSQPRVASGPEGGEWTSGGGGSSGGKPKVGGGGKPKAGGPNIETDSSYSGPSSRANLTKKEFAKLPASHRELVQEHSLDRIQLGTPTTIAQGIGSGTVSGGHYSWSEREIVMGSGNNSDSDYSKVLTHEVGHAVDRGLAVKSGFSGTFMTDGPAGKSLLKAFTEESHALEKLNPSRKGALAYYRQNHREAFAETYRMMHGSVPGVGSFSGLVKSSFPKSIAVVQGMLKKGKLS